MEIPESELDTIIFWGDKPEFSEDEVVALAKNGIIQQGFLGWPVVSVDIDVSYYVGDGKWSGSGEVTYLREGTAPRITWVWPLSLGPKDVSEPRIIKIRGTHSITWNYYEKSKTVEIVEHKATD